MKVSKSYSKKYNDYSFSFHGLSKQQVNILSYLLKYLTSEHIVYQYSNGFTLPYLAVSSLIPLAESNGLLLVPNNALHTLCDTFGNNDLPTKDVVCDRYGKPISKIKYYE